jgi:hypothetical protein
MLCVALGAGNWQASAQPPVPGPWLVNMELTDDFEEGFNTTRWVCCG